MVVSILWPSTRLYIETETAQTDCWVNIPAVTALFLIKGKAIYLTTMVTQPANQT